MFSRFPVNDDWIFVRQVEAFSEGIYSLSAKLDPSFLSQGFLGLVWGKLFGISFLSLQTLTLLVTGVFLVVMYKILGQLDVQKRLKLLLVILFTFNPLIYTSAFSFMTDNYFLMFSALSIYFYVSYFVKSQNSRNLVFGSFFAVLAMLVRQIGVLLFPAFLLPLILAKDKHIKIISREVILTCTFMFLGTLIILFWPRVDVNRAFLLAEELPVRLSKLVLSSHYFLVFLFPLFYGLCSDSNKYVGRKRYAYPVLVGFSVMFFAWFLYTYDFFPVGNVLYLEGLHTKSDFRADFSLFDNVFFKTMFALILSFAFTKLIENVKGFFKGIDSTDKFLGILCVLNIVALALSSDFYDRYLLPAFMCFALIFVKKLGSQIRITSSVLLTTLITISISIFLQIDFINQNNLKWELAEDLSKKTGYVTQIDLNNTYTSYAIAVKENDYSGLADVRAFEKNCFVQKYTLDGEHALLVRAQRLDDFIRELKYWPDSKPLDTKKRQGVSRAKNNLGELIENKEYFSPLYNLVGKKAFVASWCND